MPTLMAPRASETAPVAMTFSSRDLEEAAAHYIHSGSSALPEAILGAVQAEIARRMAQAESQGLTRRDVVKSLLEPVLQRQGHCRCARCQRHCAVCRSSAASTTPRSE